MQCSRGVGENATFLAGDTGRLAIADAPGKTSAFAGHVSGFGHGSTLQVPRLRSFNVAVGAP
jgi:hypothetical protein